MVPSDQDQKNRPPKKGFAGLNSMVSDIGGSVPPPVQPSPKPEPATDTTVKEELSPKRQQSTQPNSQVTPPPTNGNSASTVYWIVGGLVFLLIISQLGKKETPPTPFYSPPPLQPSQSAPGQNSVSPPQPQLVLPSRFTEDRPPVGDGLTHGPSQLRYCAAEKIRLDAAESVINNYSQIDVDRFNDMVSDFNSRCGHFRYRRGTLESARSDVEKYRSELEAEGRNRFSSRSGSGFRPLPSKSKPVQPDATIMEIQRRLNAFGYPVGIPDGLNGPVTIAAIKAFQKDQGQPITGVGSLDMFRQARVVEKTAPKSSPKTSVTEQANNSASTPNSAPSTPGINPPKILGANFGIMVTDVSGNRTFKTTDGVPLKPGQPYGWFVKLENPTATVRWREELTVPYPPRTWGTEGSSASHSFSPDGRTLITNSSSEPKNGIIYHFWSVADGDPIGLHTIKVFIEDQHVRTFVFSVNR